MPTYDYCCKPCKRHVERVVPIARRDKQTCEICGSPLTKLLAAPLFKFQGRVTPGGGPDRFTADMLGIPLAELPAGLKLERR